MCQHGSKKNTVASNSAGPSNRIITLSSATNSVTPAELKMAQEQVEISSKRRKNYTTNIPTKIKNEMASYASEMGTHAALQKFKVKYPQYTLIRTPVNNWKSSYQKINRKVNFKKKGRPNKLDEEMLRKIIVTRKR